LDLIFNHLASVDQTFFKFNALDKDRIQIVLWDYRHTRPLQVGMVINLEGEDFDEHTLNWILASLCVNMANYIMNMASMN
jgi:hypothetical protein